MNEISEAFILIAERCAREYGTPLPTTRLLEFGDDTGWRVQFNATRAEVDDIPPYTARLSWCGWPAGFVGPAGGTMAAGSAANEDALCEWLQADAQLLPRDGQ